MRMKSTLSYLWKLPVCGLAFFIGMAIGGAVLSGLDLKAPEMPAGTDANTVAMWFFLGSMLIALGLSFVSKNLNANCLIRWIVLAELIWIVAVVSMVLESFFFMTTGAVSTISSGLYTLLSFFAPTIFLAGMITTLFRPEPRVQEWIKSLRAYFSTRRFAYWLWRGLAAFLAFPLIYIAFGLLVAPFVRDYYILGANELKLPTWSHLITLQTLRSSMFLLACLPVVFLWRGSRGSLIYAMGVSLFVLTAFMAVITSYWFPWQMRLFHGLELLADAFIYASFLTVLFRTQREGLETKANAAGRPYVLPARTNPSI